MLDPSSEYIVRFILRSIQCLMLLIANARDYGAVDKHAAVMSSFRDFAESHIIKTEISAGFTPEIRDA